MNRLPGATSVPGAGSWSMIPSGWLSSWLHRTVQLSPAALASAIASWVGRPMVAGITSRATGAVAAGVVGSVEGTSPLVEAHPAAQRAQLDLPKIPLMSKDFISVDVKAGMAPSIPVEVKDRAWVQETDAPPCHECGTLMVRNGACHKCPNCGSTSGCS